MRIRIRIRLIILTGIRILLCLPSVFTKIVLHQAVEHEFFSVRTLHVKHAETTAGCIKLMCFCIAATIQFSLVEGQSVYWDSVFVSGFGASFVTKHD